MTNLESEITQYVESTKNSIELTKAPDVSQKIWQQYQSRKYKRYLTLAASVCVICVTFWLQQVTEYHEESTDAKQSLLLVNAELEEKLLKVASNKLSEQQVLLMTNWYHQLALIDQTIELQQSEKFDMESWTNRKLLLAKMVEFYLNPIDVYEI